MKVIDSSLDEGAPDEQGRSLQTHSIDSTNEVQHRVVVVVAAVLRFWFVLR